MAQARHAFIAIYACSGAAGLLYEIVWTRLLSLHMGQTVAATATVLAAFMGGLAVGAFAGGAAAARLASSAALRAYAFLEVAIAAYAAGVPAALGQFDRLLRAAYTDSPDATFALARLITSLALVFIPAAAMGATFPLAVRWFAGGSTASLREASRLYAWNTIGAAVGALATGFVLVPLLGLRASTFVGMTLNAVAASAAWVIAVRRPPASTRLRQRAPPARSRRADPDRLVPLWLPAAIVAISGFCALAYQVVFTRLLASALGPTTYAFAAMLTAFIGGHAAGARLAGWVTPAPRQAAFAAALVVLAGAACALAAGWFAAMQLPLVVTASVTNPAGDPLHTLVSHALFGVGVLLPLGCVLGAVFPLALAQAMPSTDRLPKVAAVLYGTNTAGAVGGALAAAFLLVPWFGLQQTLRILAGLSVAAASLAAFAGLSKHQRKLVGAAAVAVAGIAAFVPRWSIDLLSSGAYKYAPQARDAQLDVPSGLRAGRLLYYKEGGVAVSVRQLAGTRALAIDGKVDASNGADMLTQKLLAHVPLLLHPNPRRAAIVGLGSGITLGAALRHDVEAVDVLEISPEVVEASSFFAAEHGGALDDPRTRLIVGDGRTHLRLTAARYDVLISEPSNPWMAGVAALFTREFFLSAKDRLASGGIICQWAHTYDIADADLRSIAATFRSVFPNAALWLIGDGDVLLVASNNPADLPLDNITRNWRRPAVAADLAAASVHDPFSLLSLYVAGPRALQRYTDGAFIQSDDHPLIEFSGPVSIHDRNAGANLSALRAMTAPDALPETIRLAVAAAGAREWTHRGQMLVNAHAYSSAFDDFSRSVQQDPQDETAFEGLIEATGASGRVTEALQLLETLAPRSFSAASALARVLAAAGSFEPARAWAEKIAAADPRDPRSLELLASVLADARDLRRLEPVVMRMRETQPDRDETWYYSAMVSFLRGNLPEAIARAEQVVRRNPRHTLAHNLIGSAHANLGRRDQARRAFHASLETDAREPSTYANLGLLELEGGNRAAAAGYFAEALSLDPDSQIARENLPVALAETR